MSEQRLIDIAPILSKLEKEKQEHEKRLNRYKQLRIEEPDNNYNDWDKKIAYEQDWISEINHSVFMLTNAPTIEPVHGEWISVKDGLPTAREDVLVVAYWHEKYQVLIGWFSPNGKVWRVTTPNGEMTDVSVTHWMPLPEPPKEESK